MKRLRLRRLPEDRIGPADPDVLEHIDLGRRKLFFDEALQFVVRRRRHETAARERDSFARQRVETRRLLDRFDRVESNGRNDRVNGLILIVHDGKGTRFVLAQRRVGVEGESWRGRRRVVLRLRKRAALY